MHARSILSDQSGLTKARRRRLRSLYISCYAFQNGIKKNNSFEQMASLQILLLMPVGK
jgi:hypothetical protein